MNRFTTLSSSSCLPFFSRGNSGVSCVSAGQVHASIEPCIAFIKRNIALSSQVGEVYREDRLEYPLEAVREAVTNAVLHRDYAIADSYIKIAIFDDMLEITSPGPLPDNLAPEALGTGRSEIRNRVLTSIFKDLRLVEMTIPEKPRSNKQRYRLTAKGKARLQGAARRNG